MLDSSLTDSLPSLNLLCYSKTDAWFMQDAPKAVWRIPYVSLAFFPSLKHNFIAYRSSKVSSRPDCIFEIHQLWQSGFSRVYSNCCCSCWLEPKILKIGQWSHKMYSNNIVNFQESTPILHACTKSIRKLTVCTIYIYIYIYIYFYISQHRHTHTYVFYIKTKKNLIFLVSLNLYFRLLQILISLNYKLYRNHLQMRHLKI